MNELKTLEEIWKDGKWSIIRCNHQAVDLEELKEEAIKDIKYLRAWKNQGILKLLPWITTTDMNNTGLNAIINYIKWKFNITEEDLK